jgi:hypothetical protein
MIMTQGNKAVSATREAKLSNFRDTFGLKEISYSNKDGKLFSYFSLSRFS